MKYVIYLLTAALVIWAVGYLIYRFHGQLRGRRGCDCGGCPSCPHTGCRHRREEKKDG